MSVAKAKKAIANYKKAIGAPDGLAELSIFYCEEVFNFIESCGFEDERYFVALIAMYDQAVKRTLEIPIAQQPTYTERLGKLRSRGRPAGWGLGDEINSIWCEAGFDEY